jgi:hypothetical protein
MSNIFDINSERSAAKRICQLFLTYASKAFYCQRPLKCKSDAANAAHVPDAGVELEPVAAVGKFAFHALA